jgi:hypothetical protein
MKNIHAYKKYRLLITTILFFSCNLASCTTYTHVVDLKPQAYPHQMQEYEVIEAVEGKSSSFTLFWVIPVTKKAAYSEAIDTMIKSKGGDNLIDVRLWHERQYWILGTVNIYHAKGTVIRYQQ